MAVAYVGNAAAAVGSGSASVAPTIPAGSAGQMLLAFCWANNSASTWSATGWTSVLANAGIGCAILQRFADGTEGATMTFTRTTTTAASGVVVTRISGANVVANASLTAGTTVATIALAQVAAAAANTLLLQAVSMLTTTAATWTAPGTATQRTASNAAATGSAVNYGVGDELVGVGATGTRTWTHSGTQASKGALIAVTPAPDWARNISTSNPATPRSFQW